MKIALVMLVLAGGASYIVRRPCSDGQTCQSCGCQAGESCEHVRGDKRNDAGLWPRTRCVSDGGAPTRS